MANPLANSEFGGIRTFLHAPYFDEIEKTDADVVVVGVPFDQGTSARSGARYGPRDIREGSMMYSWATKKGFFYIDGEKWVLQGTRWADVGDVDVATMDPAFTFACITEAVRAIRGRNALPVVLGGDHSISFPVIRAYELPTLTVVHFDAHLDSYGVPSSNDAISTFVTDHGCWVSAISGFPGIKIVQIG